MRLIKRIISIVVMMTMLFVINSSIAKANGTIKVTADTLNLREKASTNSDILTLLSKGDKCELIEEEGDWYKVKYKTYTGYVTKEYAEKEQITSTTQQGNNDQEEGNNKPNDEQTTTSSNEENTQIIGKLSKKANVKLLPLIYSSEIDSLNKGTIVTIVTEINGWSYIQTDIIAGWIRSDNITDRKKTTTDNQPIIGEDNKTNNDKPDNTQGDNGKTDTDDNKDDKTFTEKTMYVNDSYVNLRKEASTSSDIIMVVSLNTKLTVIGESGEWYQVKTTEGNAYVSKKLLSGQQVTSSRGGIVKVIRNSTDGMTQTTKEDNSTSTNSGASNTAQTSNTGNNKNEQSNNSVKGQEIVSYAKQFLGVPYVYGGASKSGFDCSGFTMYVYQKFGISMRHGAQAQAKLGKAINANKNSATSLKENLQAGDLVFFLDYETMDEIGHCGIYVGNGNFIHASSGSGYCVKINSLLPGEYYNTRYCAARRVI